MEKKKDLRIIRTKKMLHQALIELMKDKTFEEIKVCDICDKAMINRSTFYAHYDDKYELLLDFINTLKIEFSEEMSKYIDNLNTKEYYIKFIGLFLDYMDSKKDVYNAVMINNRNSIMMDILLSVVNDDIFNKLKYDETLDTKVPKDIITKFYLGGVINLGVEWLKDNSKYTKQQILSYLDILIPEIPTKNRH